MNIGQFAERTGLSAHTLRYYEKIGLLRHIARDASGIRIFTERDLEWVGFIKRLKDTGMPIDDILVYADLREAGETTLAARRALLEQHARALQARLDRDRANLAALEHKIAWYKRQMDA